MTPLERAARAAKQALLDDPETDAWMGAEDDPDDFRVDGTIRLTPVARAVLQAIRVPSEGMLRRDLEERVKARHWFAKAPEDVRRREEGVAGFQAMIDAALEEG